MNSLTLLSILWRRWFVVLPVAILTAAAGVVVAGFPDVRYETYGSELLVTRSQTAGQLSTAPLLSTNLLSSFVAESLQRPEFELGLREAGFASDFEVDANADSTVITVTVTGEDPNDVFSMAETIIDRAPGALASFLGSDLAATIDLSPLTLPTQDQIVELDNLFSLSVPLAAWTNTANVSNPFAVSGSTMRTLGEIASRKQLAIAVEEEVPSGSFRVSSDARASAPIISIQASADDPGDVLRVYEIVRADLDQRLVDLQTAASVRPENQTVFLQLVPPETIEQTRSSTVRPAAGITLLGLGFACLAAILIDLGAQRRSKRRTARRMEQTSASVQRSAVSEAEPTLGPKITSTFGPEIESTFVPEIKSTIEREIPSANEAPTK